MVAFTQLIATATTTAPINPVHKVKCVASFNSEFGFTPLEFLLAVLRIVAPFVACVVCMGVAVWLWRKNRK